MVPGAQRVGPQNNPPFDLGAKPGAARLGVRFQHVRPPHPRAIADAVESREIRARLRRRDQIVNRHRIIGVRQRNLHHLRAEVGELADRRAHRGLHFPVHARDKIFFRQPNP